MLPLVDAQAALVKLGYAPTEVIGADCVNALFREALLRFQRYHRACGEVDGWYGPKTDAVLAPLEAKLRTAPPAITACRRVEMLDYVIGDVRSHGAGGVPVYDPEGAVLAEVSPGAYVDAVLQGESLLADGRHSIRVAGWRDVGGESILYKPVLGVAKRHHWVPATPQYAGIVLTNDHLTVRRVRTFTRHEVGEHGWPVAAPHQAQHMIDRHQHLEPFVTALVPIDGALGLHDRVFVLELAGQRVPDRRDPHDGWIRITGYLDHAPPSPLDLEIHLFAGGRTLRDRGPTQRLQPVHGWSPAFR